ncbi:MAG: hypothetical protein JWM11_5608 [Planctomycetaceae bacterium]|nr:hypothetical protein [Planctomycetaceae bacterium]
MTARKQKLPGQTADLLGDPRILAIAPIARHFLRSKIENGE